MSTSYISYPAGKSIYSKVSLTAEPWESDATDLTEVGSSGLYQVDTDAPYLFLGTAGSAASTDTAVGTVGDFYYGTVDGGDVYMHSRLHAWDWNNAPLLDKVRALQNATYLIDKFNFIGSKVESDQALQFPRQCVASDGTITTISSGEIPQDIEQAAYLIADALLSGRDPEEDFEALRNKVETFGPVRTEFATDKGPPQHLSNLIPSPEAWAKIQPYLKISTSFTLNRG